MEPRAFTVLWTSDYCRKLKRAGDLGTPLRVVFGGSHQSQPLLSSFGVAPGDLVYPIRVHDGALFVVARMRVREFVDLQRYLADVLGLGAPYTQLHLWDLETRLASEHPEWGHLLPWGCLVEVALGDEGAPIRLDRVVPPETVEQLRFVSRGGERGIKYLEEGRIKRSVSLQGGTYRLTPQSAVALARLVDE